MKEVGTSHWQSPNKAATNEASFTALPGGYRYGTWADGTFYLVGSSGYWWSSSEGSTYDAWYRRMGYVNSDVGRYSYSKPFGLSVRCLRD